MSHCVFCDNPVAWQADEYSLSTCVNHKRRGAYYDGECPYCHSNNTEEIGQSDQGLMVKLLCRDCGWTSESMTV